MSAGMHHGYGFPILIDAYHYYGAVSERCASIGAAAQTTAAAALSKEWLSQADTVGAFYAGLRDKFEPGKPLWVTETADAACGGNPWGTYEAFRHSNSLVVQPYFELMPKLHQRLEGSVGSAGRQSPS